MGNLNKKSALYIGGGILTIVIGYFLYDLIKGNKEAKQYGTIQDQNTNPNKTTTSLTIDEISSNATKQSNDTYPLKIGSYGSKVYVLQDALNTLGASIIVDGRFGQNTYKAVNKISGGFGVANILCKLDYGCSVSYENWNNIITKAEAKGFNTNASWTAAKKTWKV